ncbi:MULTISPECIES: hypothetical protein [unclassified Burkholderia]|uniref:hypothetical protein n=1 Tax=unclassified Burkholderia TaxID=2613784 RepID=UPI000F5768A3|nr:MULTISPECIES: hypothetical protein [unclassified Burkholderia]
MREPIIDHAGFHSDVIKGWIIAGCSFCQVFMIIKMTRHANPRRRIMLPRPFLRRIGGHREWANAPAGKRKEMESGEIKTYNAGVVSGVPI